MTVDEHGENEAVGLRQRKKLYTRRMIHEAAMELVTEHGLDTTTIEQICETAEVSPRTFFNYFPSKVAAVLDLPETPVPPEAIERFRGATGGLVPALRDLLVAAVDSRIDRIRIKRLIKLRPELVPELNQWMVAARDQFVAMAEERASSREIAAAGVTLVMAAAGMAVHDRDHADEPLAHRLDQAIKRLAEAREAMLEPVRDAGASPGGDPAPGRSHICHRPARGR